MNEKVIKALHVGTAGVIAATTAVSPAMVVSADSVEYVDQTDSYYNADEFGVYNADTGNVEGGQNPTEDVYNGDTSSASEQGSTGKTKSFTSEQSADSSNTIGAIGKLSGNYVENNGKLYVNGTKATITATSLVQGTKLSKVIVSSSKKESDEIASGESSVTFDLTTGSEEYYVIYKTQKEVDNETDDTTEESKEQDAVEEDTIVVTLSSIISEVSGGVVEDTTGPELTLSSMPGISKNDTAYIGADGTIIVNCNDEGVGVDRSYLKVTNAGNNVECTYDEGSGNISIRTKELPEGNSTLVVSARDLLGTASVLELNVCMLREDYQLTGTSHGKVVNNQGKSFITEPIDVQLNGYDSDKITNITLIKDEEEITDVRNGSFVISGTGNYKLKVTDVLGDVKIFKMSDLFNDLSSDVVLDTEAPKVNIKIGDKSLSYGEWIKEGFVLKAKYSDDAGLNKLIVNINGKDYTKKSSGLVEDEFDIDIEKDIPHSDNGIYDISASVEDEMGNVTHLEKISVKIDFADPVIDDISYSGSVQQFDDKLYVSEPLKIKGNVKDADSGVASVILYRDNKLYSDKGFPFEIRDSGNYHLEVKDNSGREVSISLADLVKGPINSSNVVYDMESPEITRVSGFEPTLEYNNTNWYKKGDKLVYKIKDENIRNVSITVNGEEQVGELNSYGDYSVDFSNRKDGKYDVVVNAVDYAGNASTDSFSFNIDSSTPVVAEAELSEEGIERLGTIFFKKIPSIVVKATDDGIGVDKYMLSGSKEESSSNGTFALGDGSYYVSISDKIKNKTKDIPVSELVGLNSNTFVVDSKAPTISCTRPSGSVNDWFGKDVSYNIDLKDNIGISSANLKINGKEVGKFNGTKNYIKNVSLQADTADVAEPEDGKYVISVEVTDHAGNTSSWSDTIYIDRTNPTISEFVFNGTGRHEGKTSKGSGRYGFFFDGGATCDIYVNDGNVSSGVDTVYVTLENTKGNINTFKSKVSGGVASVNIPNGFKGYISAYAVDAVGHKGKSNSPDGVVTESSNWHFNHTSLNIVLPSTQYKDRSGIDLYNKDVTASANIGCSMSGIRSVAWGIGDKQSGGITVDSNGNASGDVSSISESDKNLVLSLTEALNISGNSNGMKIWVRVTDRAGHTSETSRVISIDKDAPLLSVDFDTTEKSGFYNKERKATITVKERNFNPNLVEIKGNSGRLGTWSSNGDTWTNTITFEEGNGYNFTVDVRDMAGNSATQFKSETFTIDKTNPKINVSWDNSKPVENNFYKGKRVATITVIDRNFDSSKVKFTGDGKLSDWNVGSESSTATVTFDKDGEYQFGISCEDKCGNKSDSYDSGKFIVDVTRPVVEIVGVEQGMSYKKDVAIHVKMSDKYLDSTKSSVTLKGKRNKDIALDGKINGETGDFILKELPNDEKYDDIYTLTVKAVDKAGNTIDKEIKFSVNRFGSKYKFLDASILGTYMNKAQNITITEENVDKLNIKKAKVVVIRDGSEIKLDKKYLSIVESVDSDGKYTYTYVVKKEAFDKDGKYLIQIYSTADNGTSYSSVSQEYAFVLDTQKPEIIVSGVESDKTYNSYNKTVTIDVRDATGVKDIEVSLNGKKVQLSKENDMYSFEVIEKEGVQAFTVNVTDLAGNTSKVNVSGFRLTSNTVTYVTNQSWFKFGIGLAIAFLGAIIALIAKGRFDSKKEEEKMLEEHSKLYTSSASSSSSSSSTGEGTEERSKAEDLENKDDSEE